MITVTIVKDGFDYKGIRSEGHANYAPHGQDIVCASISALIQTAIQGIINLSKYDEYHMDSGRFGVTVSIDTSKAEQERANAILATIELGIIVIRNMHEEYISIIYEESVKNEEV